MISVLLREAIDEAERFVRLGKDLLASLRPDEALYGSPGTKRSGAVRRASMDLTRALARLRGRTS